MKDIQYWIWFALRCGAGSADGVRLLELYGSDPREVYDAAAEELEAVEGFPRGFMRRFADKSLSDAGNVIEFCFMNEIRVLTCIDPDYPERLRSLYNRPILLYARGNIERLSEKLCVGVVGTRNMTDYGKHAAFDIVRNLCAHGAVIVSGAAYGIDSVASNTALYFESETIAVLGCGVNVPYPRENREMLEKIAAKGLVLSEFAPGTAPNAGNFPIRNRIISGLSDAVLVVEADARSGALITARHAAEQGRAVYAVPGDIDRPSSRGANSLIRDGAGLCARAEDIIADFTDRYKLERVESIVRSEEYIRYEMRSRTRTGFDSRPQSQSKPGRGKPAKPEQASPEKAGQAAPVKAEPPSSRKPEQSSTVRSEPAKVGVSEKEKTEPNFYTRLDPLQRQVYDALPEADAVSPDQLTGSGLTASDILSSLTILELYGAVESLPGGMYRRLI